MLVAERTRTEDGESTSKRATSAMPERSPAPRRLIAPGTPPQTARRSMGHRGPRVVRKAKRLGWRSPMTAAVLVGTFLVTLLSIYVSAYARVTQAGFQLSSLRRQMLKAEQEEQVLTAEVSRLKLRGTVGQHAEAIGMTLLTPGAAQVLSVAEPQRAAQTD